MSDPAVFRAHTELVETEKLVPNIRVWSIFDLGRKIPDVVGGLAGSAIDTFAGEQ